MFDKIKRNTNKFWKQTLKKNIFKVICLQSKKQRKKHNLLFFFIFTKIFKIVKTLKKIKIYFVFSKLDKDKNLF